MKKSFISFILIFSVVTLASQENIKEALKNILPDGAVIELIEPSPIPGMYAVTSKPEVNLTRATLRNAEFGFLGVVV